MITLFTCQSWQVVQRYVRHADAGSCLKSVVGSGPMMLTTMLSLSPTLIRNSVTYLQPPGRVADYIVGFALLENDHQGMHAYSYDEAPGYRMSA